MLTSPYQLSYSPLYPSQLQNYCIELHDSISPIITLRESIRVPDCVDFERVKIKGSLVVLYGAGLAILDLEKKGAVWFTIEYDDMVSCILILSIPVQLIVI